MGTTDSNGVWFWDENDIFAPVHTALNLGQSNVSTLVGQINAKLNLLDPTLPLTYTRVMTNTSEAVTSTTFANLPGTNLNVVLPRKALVELSTNAWLQIASFSSGSVELRSGVAVTGATVVAPNAGVPGSTGNWGGVLWLGTGATGGRGQSSSTRLMELNAGTNTFNLQAYRTSSAVSMSVSYAYYIVKILKWL